MRVLMFGWEFPPHISGGLGTACFGLTQALAMEHTQILFVVPRTDIQSTEERVTVISASEVTMPVQTASARREEGSEWIGPVMETEVVTISVPSGLSPYTGVDILQSFGLSRWNYPLSERTDTINSDYVTGRKRYQFSGQYGPGLLKEVDRYAEVAIEISSQNHFDVIHVHDWLTFPAGAAAKRISGKPLVAHVHATEFDRAGENINPDLYDIERLGMETADRVIAVSQRTKNIIVKNYGIRTDKVYVVHNGIMDRRDAGPSSAPPLGKRIVTFLGRITYQKGPRYFIEAARRVLDRFPDVHFVMAGSGDLMAKMIERVAELRMSSHFHFTGFLRGTQVDRIWSGSEVFVMPSVSEPFGIAPLEAIQAGVPVVISKQSGVAEVLDHAIKVDFWDTQALADAICNILRHKGLKKTLTMKSMEEVREITWSPAAKKINELYYELTA